MWNPWSQGKYCLLYTAAYFNMSAWISTNDNINCSFVVSEKSYFASLSEINCFLQNGDTRTRQLVCGNKLQLGFATMIT